MDDSPVDLDQLKKDIFQEFREIETIHSIVKNPWFVRAVFLLVALFASENLSFGMPVLIPVLFSWIVLVYVLLFLLLFGMLKRVCRILLFLWHADSQRIIEELKERVCVTLDWKLWSGCP